MKQTSCTARPPRATTAERAGTTARFAAELQREVYQVDRVLGLIEHFCVTLHGTTVAQTYALLALTPAESMTMHELSEAMDLAGSTMTRLADRLVANGFAERVPDDEDRRLVKVTLTDEGRELGAHMQESYRDLFARVAERIDEGDREAFLRGLRQVVTTFSAFADCC